MLGKIYRNIRSTGMTSFRWPIVIVALVLMAAALVEPVNLGEAAKATQLWVIDQRNLGVIGFVLACTILMAIVIPEAVLGVAAGSLFGFMWGSIWFTVSGLLSTLLVFILARRYLQGPIQSFLARRPKLQAIETTVSDSGLRLLCLLRLLPLNPAIMSYALATTKIGIGPYLLASCCMIPGWILTVYFGYVATDVVAIAGGASEFAPLQDTLKIAGLVLAIGVMIYVTRVAAKQCSANDPAGLSDTTGSEITIPDTAPVLVPEYSRD